MKCYHHKMLFINVIIILKTPVFFLFDLTKKKSNTNSKKKLLSSFIKSVSPKLNQKLNELIKLTSSNWIEFIKWCASINSFTVFLLCKNVCTTWLALLSFKEWNKWNADFSLMKIHLKSVNKYWTILPNVCVNSTGSCKRIDWRSKKKSE